jgi:predicted Zn-dependent protease
MTDVLSIAASQHGSSENWSKVIGVGVGLYARGLDKNDEFEADRMGVVIAARAGYDPFGLPAVLLILDTVNAKDSSFALMFKTHPAPEARLQALETVMGADMDKYAGRMPPNKRFDAAVR